MKIKTEVKNKFNYRTTNRLKNYFKTSILSFLIKSLSKGIKIHSTITASNAILVAAQNQSKLAKKWGGGDIASADGMRFVVPVRSLHAAPNPKYFNQGRGVTWYNLLSNQRTGLNDVTVPGTLRDSLILFNMLGRYSFSMPDEVKDGQFRSLRDPSNP